MIPQLWVAFNANCANLARQA
ncbi:hypothetical protein WH5701_03289 [Synechococcus sp. WH 5701]|nr:hypothetical protein WH5701_03289 [Synechococcus sp. WH 5701]